MVVASSHHVLINTRPLRVKLPLAGLQCTLYLVNVQAALIFQMHFEQLHLVH